MIADSLTGVTVPSVTITPEIDELWDRRDELSPDTLDAAKVVLGAVDELDLGAARVASVDPDSDEVVVDERAKRAILLAFRVLPMVAGNAGGFYHHDRVPLKSTFTGVRVVPGAVARWGSFLEPGVVLMPSYVNIGGYVGEGTLVDTWATVASCAQVGKRVHLSGGVGLGGVLEPVQAKPVVIEDDAFIGSRSIIVEGARVRRGATLGSASLLTASTHVVDANSGAELPRGEIPARAVAVASTRVKSFPGGDFGMPIMLVLRVLAEDEVHNKTVLNDVLREQGITS